uniref:Uncharacterized protein n=1 Tax=Amphimedon queenslandica TaxID=400682 RepID=A0A1X7TAV4_AMPQE
MPSSLELPHKKYGHTPFLIAVYFNQLEVIKYLISKNCNLSATDNNGSGAVHISVATGHLNVLKYLIDNNYCNPNVTDNQDRTPLHVAVSAEQLELLEYLLAANLNLNSFNKQDKDGDTPLHFACMIGQQKMVSLLSRFTNINIANKKGQTPLHLAVASGHKDTTEALLFSVTVFLLMNLILWIVESTILHAACEGGNMELVQLLIVNCGLDPEGQDKSGITCMHILLSLYNPDDPDNNGYTSVHAACEAGKFDLILQFLTELCCNALAEMHGKKTLLYFASMHEF